MTQEEVLQNILRKFPFLDGKIRAPRARRIFTDDITVNFDEVFNYAIKDLEFSIMLTITGLDEGEKITLAYHIARTDGNILTLKKSVPKNDPVIKTITPQFFGADIYERELIDLLGVRVEGLPAGNRYPLPDNWPKDEYPLRKDWKKSGAKEENKPNEQA